MELKEILDVLVNQMHTVVLSSIDKNHNPISTVVDLILDNNTLYFMIARGNDIYSSLLKSEHMTLTGFINDQTLYQTITLSGKIKNIKQNHLNIFFEKNKYLQYLYPDIKSRNIFDVFEIDQYEGEYLDLSHNPVLNHTFSYHKKSERKVYVVGHKCIYCKACFRICPQKCIDISSKPVKIINQNCLKCGKCMELCPRKAIEKRSIHSDCEI
ncbi:MAG: 4Fe-4S binding protein [Faecalibacillus sp.]